MTNEPDIPQIKPVIIPWQLLLLLVVMGGVMIYIGFFSGPNEIEVLNMTTNGDNITNSELCSEICDDYSQHYYTLRDYGYGNVVCYCKFDSGKIKAHNFGGK